MCGCSAARRSIHVAAANGMTTSLLPITICLLCANLSQHIQVWPCPHLTLSESRTQGGTWGREGKEEKIRALTKTAALGANSERSTGVYQRAETRNIHSGSPGDSAGSGTNHIPATPWIQIWTGTFVTCLHCGPIFPIWAFYAKDRNTPPPQKKKQTETGAFSVWHIFGGMFLNLVAEKTGAKTRFLQRGGGV